MTIINRFSVILAAAGKSARFKDSKNTLYAKNISDKKPFIPLCGKSVWEHSVSIFATNKRIDQIIIVVAPEDYSFFETKFSEQINKWRLELVMGGQERFESIENALKHVRTDIDFIAIHDAARPCVTKQQIHDVFQTAEQFGAAILASPLVGTIKRTVPTIQIEKKGENFSTKDIIETIPRDNLWEAQTPQVFQKKLIIDAYANRKNVTNITDDAQLVENLGRLVKIVPSDRSNIKITTISDLLFAEQFLKR
ncbi:MAG: 2-C-methyl-D-erythritol 4-phosphate cytidylyltransferase [Planctomycetaceae bacterium]|jgi:2-C-methyl-D-erythritol 4-phosphate cytidylyltransferase|nr:2-C-methyl-D-erythritol 4-phosphate cytidylyltransferase [Planctomycetaceae bacterium]